MNSYNKNNSQTRDSCWAKKTEREKNKNEREQKKKHTEKKKREGSTNCKKDRDTRES